MPGHRGGGGGVEHSQVASDGDGNGAVNVHICYDHTGCPKKVNRIILVILGHCYLTQHNIPLSSTV